MQAHWFRSIVFALALLCSAVPAVAAPNDPLFVNLTTDDPHRANMGITFGTMQMNRGHPLTIFLNDRAVALGAKSQSGKFGDHQKSLQEVMSKGATVLICPMCMKHYGVSESDLLPGIKTGNPQRTGDALFKDNTKTMTW